MRQQTGRRWAVPILAWGLCALFVVMWLLTAGFVSGSEDGDRSALVLVTVESGWALVGALVAIREPRNVVGWLMLAIATSIATTNVVNAYVSDLDRPGVVWVAYVGHLASYVVFYLVAFPLPLFFPDGRLLSSRWRAVVWLGVVAFACSLGAAAFGSWPLEVAATDPIANPLALSGDLAAVVSVMAATGNVLFTLGAGLSIVSLLVRLHRARGRRRQQVKWFIFAATLALGSLLLANVEGLAPGVDWAQTFNAIWWAITLLLVSIGIPAAVGIAILRHRLYDIDLVIRRAVVYGSLTLTLYGVYLVSVVALPRLLPSPTGDNDLAVAASTLAVAALFRPVRGRIQQVVDRRFYRSRYDAARTVESFAARLRHEVDLAAVSTDLRVVVRDTVQPTHVSLWLRGTL